MADLDSARHDRFLRLFVKHEGAVRGFVSMSGPVDTMWSQKGWWQGRKPETDLGGGVQQVIELRRALDLLLAQPGVDATRVALVAHDFGAMFGAVMGAADGRPKAYVFLAPTPRLSDWYLYNVKPANVDDYKKQLAHLDPAIRRAHRIDPLAPVRREIFIPQPAADAPHVGIDRARDQTLVVRIAAIARDHF